MGRTIPIDCEHGNVLDWGDFGPNENDPLEGTCEICNGPPWKQVAANVPITEKIIQDATNFQEWQRMIDDAIRRLIDPEYAKAKHWEAAVRWASLTETEQELVLARERIAELERILENVQYALNGHEYD